MQFTSDRRMLELVEILKAKNAIKFDTDFCEAVEIKKQNFSKIKNSDKNSAQENHFTPLQIEKACKLYKVNANWIFGVADTAFRS